MASIRSFPFSVEGATGTTTEGSAPAGFSLLATEFRTGKTTVSRVGMRIGNYNQKTVLMGERCRGSGMRTGGSGGSFSWRVLCSKAGDREEEILDDGLMAMLEKNSKKIMALQDGIIEKQLDERKKIVAEIELIFSNPVDEETSSQQDSKNPFYHDLSSSGKNDPTTKERDSDSLPHVPDQSHHGKHAEKPSTVSKPNLAAGSLISTRNINSVPMLPQKSTSRRASTSKKSGRKPKKTSFLPKKIEDSGDNVSRRPPDKINGRSGTVKAPVEGIPEVIAEEIWKTVSVAAPAVSSPAEVNSFSVAAPAVSSPREEKPIESIIKEITEATSNPSYDNVKSPPLAGENVMNVILVAAECSPWKKTGGLGDVAGALPKALARRGHRVMVVVPRYGNYTDSQDVGIRKRYKVAGQDMEVNYFHAFIDGVDFVFIESAILRNIEDNIYGGNWIDILRRMTLFCKAAVEVPWHVPCGGICYGDGNLVFIANDWHTALLPVYLKAYYRDNGLMTYTRSVLVIHNIAHQGRGPLDPSFSLLDLPQHYKDSYFRLYDPVGGEHCNIFAAGIKAADRVVAVSHGYAWELKTIEGGWGLHSIISDNDWKLQGIVNGIDYNEWNPQMDEHLKSDGYTNYSLDTLPTGKAQCKAALQREMGLPVRPDVPLIGFIGRLDGQKGVDIIGESIPWMMDQDVQLVMLGTGRRDLEEMLKRFESQYKDKVRGWVGFSVKTAHRITAGVDILLMPSRFEPCGLNQLYAMCYGTIPVVHSVGGLRDTVHPYDPFNETGYGWTFDRADSGKFIEALGYCLMTYREYKKSWEGIQRRGMMQDLSWDHAAQIYEEVLLAAKYQW